MAEKVGTLVVDLEANTARFKSDLRKASGSAKEFGADLKRAASQAAAAAAIAFAAFSAFAIKAAVDAAETQAKFETVFGTATKEMNNFVATLKKTVPATTKELQDMTSSLQDLLVPFGILPDEAIVMNKAFTRLAADIASFNNIPITQALDNLRSGIVGQSEPLQKFGIDVRQASIQTKAFELGLIKAGGEITNATRAQAVLAIATEQSAFAIGDAARTMGSAANQAKFLSRNISELTQAAGESMLPAFESVVQLLVDVTSSTEDSAGAFGFLAEAVAFPVQAFFRFAEVIQRFLVTPILFAKKTLLEFVVTLTKFGRFVGIDVTAKLEDLNLAIMQTDDQMANAAQSADFWVQKQADLIDKLNVFKESAKKAKEAAKGVGDAMDESAGASARLAARAKVVAAQMEELNKTLPDLDAIMAQGNKSAMDFGNGLAVAANTAKKLTGGVRETEAELDALGEGFDKNVKAAENWGDQVTVQIDSVFDDLGRGIATAIVEWKGLWGTMKSIAGEFAKSILRITVNSLVNPLLDSFKGLFSGGGGGGFGGIFGGLKNLFGGGGGGGGGAGGIVQGAGGGFSGIGASILGSLKSVGGIISGAFKAAIPFLTNPITAIPAAIGLAIFAAFKLFTKTPFEAGAKETVRDFGVEVSKDTIASFNQGIGLSEKQFEPIRKDIQSSPKFLRDVLIPQAREQGKLDELVRSFGKLEAFGEEFDLSASVQKAIGGDFSDFNEQFRDIFGINGALISQFGEGLDALIVPGEDEDGLEGEGEEGEEPIIRTGELLGDVFVDRLDALIEIMGDGFRDLIEKLTGLVEGLQGAGAGGVTLKIETLDADSFRVWLAGDGGDVIMNELGSRRSEQLTDIISQSEQGGTLE